MNPSILALLSLGHLATDLSAGAIPALLPFFQRSFGLSYGSLGFLNGVFQFTASVTQPLVGLITDRIPGRLLLPAGCIAAGVMVGLTGFATGYGGLLLLIALAGVGVAAFHPLGYRLASQHSGERRGTATSVFSVGGLLGGAIGPLLATALVLRFDEPGTLGIAVPGLVVAGLIWWRVPRQQPVSLRRFGGGLAAPLRARLAPMSLLTLVVILRSAATVSLNTFIPLYYIDVVGESETTASRMLSLLLVSGAIGTSTGWAALRPGGSFAGAGSNARVDDPGAADLPQQSGRRGRNGAVAGRILSGVVVRRDCRDGAGPVAGERELGERHDGGVCVRCRRTGRPTDRPDRRALGVAHGAASDRRLPGERRGADHSVGGGHAPARPGGRLGGLGHGRRLT